MFVPAGGVEFNPQRCVNSITSGIFLGRQEEVRATTPRREEGKLRVALAATKIKQHEANTRLPAELHQH